MHVSGRKVHSARFLTPPRACLLRSLAAAADTAQVVSGTALAFAGLNFNSLTGRWTWTGYEIHDFYTAASAAACADA